MEFMATPKGLFACSWSDGLCWQPRCPGAAVAVRVEGKGWRPCFGSVNSGNPECGSVLFKLPNSKISTLLCAAASPVMYVEHICRKPPSIAMCKLLTQGLLQS